MILLLSLAFCHFPAGLDSVSHTYTKPDSLTHAFKDHETYCGTSLLAGGSYNYATGASSVAERGGKNTVNSEVYNTNKHDTLISNQGYLMKGALNRILSSSLESGMKLEEAVLNNKLGAFKLGHPHEDTTPIKGYRSKEDANLLGDPNTVMNVECNFASNGYGHPYCQNDKIIGEHYDLTNRKGPYRLNAHFESPSKVHQPIEDLGYHANEYKDKLMLKRVGLNENDRLLSRMQKMCEGVNCRERYPHTRRGVDRFHTPADEFHIV